PDYVRQSVRVHVVDVKLRADAEVGLVFRPDRMAVERGGLFPPAVGLDEIRPLVAVDVAHARPVRVATPLALRGDLPKGPGLCGIGGCLLDVAEMPSGVADDLRSAVAVDVEESRRLVVDGAEDEMPRPVLACRARVLVPRRGLPWQTDHQDVEPAVAVEVAREGKKVVGVLVGDTERALEARNRGDRPVLAPALEERRGGIELVPIGELGARVPERARHDVHLAVTIDVAGCRPLAP